MVPTAFSGVATVDVTVVVVPAAEALVIVVVTVGIVVKSDSQDLL